MARDKKSELEDHLLETADDAATRVVDDEYGDAVLRRVKGEQKPVEVRTPLEAFYRDLTSGRVTSAMWTCDHANQSSALILVRARGAWLLGDQACVNLQLTLRGEDSRCDWCGRFILPHLAPEPVPLRMRTVTIVARFCETGPDPCRPKINADLIV